MENSVEIVIEKLLHVTKDIIPKVTKVVLFYIVFSAYGFFFQSQLLPSFI